MLSIGINMVKKYLCSHIITLFVDIKT